MKLRLSPDLTLPPKVVTEKLAFLGRTGSGKSYAAQKLAEQLHAADAQFVALDPVGIWYGLRLDADGKSPGLPVPVLGGLRGDIPLEPTGGALIADLVVDRGVSMVLDVSQFESDADKARFAQAFAERFFFRKKARPSAVHLFIEEAQEFVPQNPQRGEERMLHAFTRLVKIGRNFGIGVSLISQRPQEINKKALNLTELLFCFQLSGKHERKAIREWIEDKAIDEDIEAILPKLKVGHPHVWSPAWLQISQVVAIDRKVTADVSSTPSLGSRAPARELSPIDMERLRTDMAATIEKAKAEDPKVLRAEIVRLKAEAKKPAAVPAAKEKRVEVEVVKPAMVQEIQRAVAALESISARGQAFLDRAGAIFDQFREGHARLGTAALQLAGALQARLHAPPAPPQRASMPAHAPARPSVPLRPRAAPQAGAGDDLDRCQRAILTVLAQHIDGCTKGKLALLSGYRWSGGFRNALSALRTAGRIEGGNTGTMRITEAGEAAGPFDPLPSGHDRQAFWLSHPSFGTCERKVLAVLIEHYPKGVAADRLTEASGYEWSGGFRNALSNLRTAGVLVGRNTEAMRASEELFV